jgi:hypothetical protein
LKKDNGSAHSIRAVLSCKCEPYMVSFSVLRGIDDSSCEVGKVFAYRSSELD